MLEVFRYRDLILVLVQRELRIRYRRSFIGFLWTMLQPFLTMTVLYVVFSAVFRFDVENFPVYALAGIVFFNFFSQSVVASMNSLRANASLIVKAAVPLEVFPISAVLSGLINWTLTVPPLLILLRLTDHPLRPSLLFLPISMAISVVFTLGVGLLLAPAAVFFHDVVEIVGVLLTMLFYMTPVFYPMAIVPDRFRFFVRYNPLRSILEVFRDPLYYAKVPPWTHLSLAVVLAAAALACGVYVFGRARRRIAFLV